MFELLRFGLVATMLNGDSFAIAQLNDVIFLPDNGIQAVDLFPCVEKHVTHRLLEEGELSLGDDVWCRAASGIDMIVAAATTPRKDDFTVCLNGAIAGDGRLDGIRMTRSRRQGIDAMKICCRHCCLPTKSRRHSRVLFANMATDLAAAERHMVVAE